MSDLPKSVKITEEGPREGFQSEPPLPTAGKIKLIESLAETGLKEINTCSFVNRHKVPQMADAEEIAAGIHKRAGVLYTGLWLNTEGFTRARQTPVDLIGKIGLSASETFGIRNNGKNRIELIEQQRAVLNSYIAAGIPLGGAYIFTSFGCNFEGAVRPEQVVRAVRDALALYSEAGLAQPVVYLCDTIGAASPDLVEQVAGKVRDAFPEIQLGLHLHDTRGLGIANALTGLRLGIESFDSSIGGLGGCPFAGNRGAAGNICTEDFAWLCETMGIATGLDLDALIESARLAEHVVGHPLPGKIYKAGRPRAAV